MRKGSIFLAHVILFSAFAFFLYLSSLEFFRGNSFFSKYNHPGTSYDGIEEYEPSLARLNSMAKLEDYCDSIFNSRFGHHKTDEQVFQENYPAVVSGVVRKRFYHGYSSYGYGNNYMALMLEPLFGKKWVSAIVIPDDMLRYSYAACSQQSLVIMEALRKKGFTTRKVGFDGGQKWGGHFCLEVYYDNSWHFFDPDREPDCKILAAYHRPSIAALASNDEVLIAAYKKLVEPEKTLGVFKTYFYGKPNVFEAPNALLYQRLTKCLSYFFWIVPLISLILLRRKYSRLSLQDNVRNRWIYFPSFSRSGSPSYYTNS